MTATQTKTPIPAGLPPAVSRRVLEEGYGPGAWYGSDVRAAIADVSAGAAFTRPAAGRHNIAEIALHHAYWAGEINRKLSGSDQRWFPLEGEDWFELADESRLKWAAIRHELDAAHERLNATVSAIAAGTVVSPLGEAERFDLVLGITGHAAYHAGQIQLIKKLI